jgi:hypothetical protein
VQPSRWKSGRVAGRCDRSPFIIRQLIRTRQCEACWVRVSVYVVRLDSVASLRLGKLDPFRHDGLEEGELADVQPELARPLPMEGACYMNRRLDDFDTVVEIEHS